MCCFGAPASPGDTFVCHRSPYRQPHNSLAQIPMLAHPSLARLSSTAPPGVSPPPREFASLLSATLSLSFPETAKPMSTLRSLTTRLILRSLFALSFIAGFLCLPAVSFRYWQGWVFIALLFLPLPITSVYFLKRHPQPFAHR